MNGTWWIEKGNVTFKKTGYVTWKNVKYYVKESKFATGWHKINNKYYYFKNGISLKGWQQLGKGTSNPDGNAAKHWSYFGNDGALRTGLQVMGTSANPDGKAEKHLSYFGDNGWLRTNQEVKVNGQRYWASTKGWAMEYAKIGNGWYNIRPKADGYQVLEVYDNKKNNSAKIQLYKNTNQLAQKFYLQTLDDGKVIIYTGTENKKKALDVTSGAKNATVNQYAASKTNQNQIWRVVKNYDSDALTFINVKTKQALCVNSVAWGERLRVKDVDNSKQQKWTLNGTWTPQYETYQTAVNDGKANAKQMEVANNAMRNISTRPLTEGFCAAWVSGVYQASGLGYPGGNAYGGSPWSATGNGYYAKWKNSGSSRMDNIPIGAAVISYPTSGNKGWGHIGIYVGKGMVVSNLGYKCYETVQKFASRGGFAGWVWPYGRHI